MTSNKYKKKLSILVPTYNHQRFIEECINSIINNLEHKNINYEILIGNDASLDDTKDILEKILNKNKSIISLYNFKVNIGGLKNIDYLLKKASGEYILIVEGDDLLSQNDHLINCVKFLDHDKEFGFVSSGSQTLQNGTLKQNSLNKYINFDLKFSALTFGNYIQMGTVVFRKELFKKFPNYFFELYFADWPLLLELLNNKKGKYFGDRSFFIYRLHDEGVWSSLSNLKQVNNTIYSLEKIIPQANFVKNKKNKLKQYLDFLYLKQFLINLNEKPNKKKILFSFLKNKSYTFYIHLFLFFLRRFQMYVTLELLRLFRSKLL